ncbi:unnamed protein product [Mytilus edulis]|uniref:Uncharacterized protein n=1 Tax=Mytilus edulis TaxID=6550 RepID=A0A8S3U7I9_MYTED|nr:unnamed protein product [Mytilus edulis]
MRWNSKTDYLFYPHKCKEESTTKLVTKREILRYSSGIYDPLGLLSPVTITAKILLQEIWKLGLQWDSIIEGDICNQWIGIRENIETATQTVFPRYYFTETTGSTQHSLHIFVDASTKAYGAVGYICNGEETALVMAKSRVAPLKELTLPQLELMAAVIGARLAKHLQSTLECENITFWSDSQIVLHWLKSTKTLKRFIQNRVNEINELTTSWEWKYCPTSDNPADLVTRGITAEQYTNSKLWIKGPHWLTDSSTYPKSTSIDTSLSVLLTENESTCISQSKDDSVCQFGINFIIDIERYSSYQKLLRITSYVLRFIENCRIEKSLRTLEHLKPSELSKSVELWIRNCQETAFATEYNALKYNNIETSKDEEARQKKEPSATTSRILPNREAATRARENIKKWTK